MANVKNFGLIGTGSTVQLGKAGPQVVASGGGFYFKNAAQTLDASIEAASLVASTGNVSLTTGNLVLSNAGVITLGQSGNLSSAAAGVYQFSGTGALIVPSGTTAQEPAASATTGGFRYNSTNSTMEYSNGTTWTTIATGGTAVTAVSVASANGFAGTSSGGTTPALTLTTSISGLLAGKSGALAAAVSGTDIKTVGGNSIIGSGDVGTISVAYGGTGATTLSGYVFGNGTGALTASSTIPTSALSGKIDLTSQVSGILPAANGGTGVANSSTITLGGNIVTGGAFTTSPANALTLTTTGDTNVTFPTSGTLATVGNTVASVSGTTNQITTSASTGALVLSIPTAFVAPGTVEVTTSLKIDGNTAGAFLFSDASSNVASTSAALNGQLLIGSTSGNPVAATLTAGTGVSITNAPGSITIANTGVTSVTAASTTSGLTISNPTVTTTGTIDFALSNELVGLDALSSESQTGFVVRTAAGTYTSSGAITGTAGDITVVNGSGVAGNPTIDLATVTQGSSGNFNKFAVDTKGRVVSNTAVVQGDLTGLLGTYYLPEAGGTMSGSINMGSNQINSLAAPTAATDAANKAYVDAAVAGLTWKTAVQVATTSAGTLATSFAAGSVVDGYTLSLNDRILIKNQVVGSENGIYVVQASGAPLRASDVSVGSTADNYAVFAESGVVNGNTGWVETANPAVVGTNALVFTQFSGAGSFTAGNGLQLVGTQFSLAGPVSIANGGTGQSTASAAFNALSPITATGDLIVGSGANSATNLSIGTTGQVLTVVGGSAAWGTNAFTIDVDGAGTGSVALGSTLSVLGATSRIHTTISGEAITVDIDAGYAGQASITTLGAVTTGTWNASTIAANHGGTGQTAYAVGDILFADTTNTLAKLSDVAAGSYLRSGGVNSAPVWSATTLPNSATTGDLIYASGANTYANLSDVATGNVLLSGGVGVGPSYGKVSLTSAVSGILPSANGGTGVNNAYNITLGGAFTTAGALSTVGAFATTFTMTGATSLTLPTSGTLATVGNTVASFSGGTTGLTPATATTGAITLGGTLATTNGGTGLTAFAANELFYASSTSAMAQSANLSFDGVSTLSVGGASSLTFDGATGTISSTATNGNIVLAPTGTGTVQIGPSGAGLITSDAASSLTITGSTSLLLNSTTSAGTVLGLGATGATITVLTSDNDATGTTYAAAIAAAPTALVNKYYVDNAIATLAQTGTIRAITATVPLNANGTTNIGAVLPAGATILSVKVNVTTADTGATVSIGKAGAIAAYADTNSNDPSSTGLYVAEDYILEASAVQVIATVAATAATAGSSAIVIVSYLF